MVSRRVDRGETRQGRLHGLSRGVLSSLRVAVGPLCSGSSTGTTDDGRVRRPLCSMRLLLLRRRRQGLVRTRERRRGVRVRVVREIRIVRVVRLACGRCPRRTATEVHRRE